MTPVARSRLKVASGAAGLVVGLVACQAEPSSTDQLIAQQTAIDPPQLWLAQVIGEAGKVKGQVFVCADSPMREAFVRARAQVNGRPCLDATSARVKPNGWTLRCTVGRRVFGESAVTLGDLQKDFVVNFALTELNYAPGPPVSPLQSVRQVRRFRHIGACPSGWRIGDQARPGRRPHRAI